MNIGEIFVKLWNDSGFSTIISGFTLFAATFVLKTMGVF